MTAIRVTMFPPHPPHDPLTVVLREQDITKSLDDLVKDTVSGLPGVFYIFDKFTSSEDMVRTSIIGGERASEREAEERNMAVLYYWLVQFLPRMHPGGVIGTKDPAPLSVSDIETTLMSLVEHPNYRSDIRISVQSADGSVVELKDGATMVADV